MKKLFFASFSLTTFLLSNGFLFRWFHWAKSDIILLGGFLVLLLAVLPLSLVIAFGKQTTLSNAEKVRIIIGLVAGMSIAVGAIFKIMHWPLANILIAQGMLLLNLIFLPLFFYQLYQKSKLNWA